jgi:hypothetical protein
MKLLLITGAGASRKLSVDLDRPMPLMQDWATKLCENIGPSLASMTRLAEATNGVEFEETLGALFRWHDQLDQAERFARMSRKAVHNDTSFEQHFRKGLTHSRQHFERFLGALHESLFEEFGPDRIDTQRAAEAYEELFAKLCDASGRPMRIICATTNYDRSTEAALDAMGDSVRSGFRPHPFRTPTLEPAGLGEFDEQTTKLLYLHGAVGWYKRDNRITQQAVDAPYNPSLGDPAVLYPGPDKDVGRSETVELWREFESAVDDATHVFVLGHALNDAHLVDALRPAGTKVGVSVYAPATDEGLVDADRIDELDQTQRVLRRLPKAHMIGVDFGPGIAVEDEALMCWQSQTTPWRREHKKQANSKTIKTA